MTYLDESAYRHGWCPFMVYENLEATQGSPSKFGAKRLRDEHALDYTHARCPRDIVPWNS